RRICCFNIEHAKSDNNSSSTTSQSPFQQFKQKQAQQQEVIIPPFFSQKSLSGRAMEDVRWSFHDKNILASSDDAGEAYIWDTRDNSKFVSRISGHKREVNSVTFSPFEQNSFVTVSSDKTCKLWDLRKTNEAVHVMR
ncbi:MAG: hypothetical protein EZS28_051241, partial [Streblomastix strix]